MLAELSISKQEDAEVFVLQAFAKEMFKSLLKFIMEKDLPPKNQTSSGKSLDTNEENALRYACGYVPHKLQKRYRRMSTNNIAAYFVDGAGQVGQLRSLWRLLFKLHKRVAEITRQRQAAQSK